PHAEGQLDRRHFLEREIAELGLADIGKAEERIAISVELGGEPDTFAERIEEFHHRHVVAIALAAVGEKLLAPFVGQEDHAALLSITASLSSADCSSSGRKERIQSAALLACEAARMMARESSRIVSIHAPM